MEAEDNQKAQTSSYKISPGDVKQSTATVVNNPTVLSQRCKHTASPKVAREDLKSSRHKKKKLYLRKVTTAQHDHSPSHTNSKPRQCMPESNMTLAGKKEDSRRKSS